MHKKSELTEDTRGRLKGFYIQEDKLVERIKAARDHGEKYIKWGWFSRLSIEEAEKKLADVRKEITRIEAMYKGLRMGERPAWAY